MSDSTTASTFARIDTDGPAAPPRANGELSFDAPWQSRVFGITMTLCDQQQMVWAEFRQLLIEEIGRWDEANPEAEREDYHYWEHWLTALTRSLGDRGLLSPDELADKVRAYAGRAPGHDHSHEHPHSHSDD